MSKQAIKTKFFHFHQNNSGGSFCSPAINVIVEAQNSEEAVSRAEDLGLYFNGCSTGDDCPCCGDRWSEPWGEGDDEPLVYDTPVAQYIQDLREGKTKFSFSWETKDVPEAVVYRYDGTQEVFRVGEVTKKGKKAA